MHSLHDPHHVERYLVIQIIHEAQVERVILIGWHWEIISPDGVKAHYYTALSLWS